MKFQPPFPARLPDSNLLGYAKAVEEYALRLRGFYNSRAIWHRRFFRLSGIMVILVGAGLPVLASLDYAGKTLVVSIAGMTVAGLTALRAFYRWDHSWILLRSTEIALTAAWWEWRSRLRTAVEDEDEPARAAAVDEAAREFARQLVEIRRREAESFFADLSFPIGDTGHARQ